MKILFQRFAISTLTLLLACNGNQGAADTQSEAEATVEAPQPEPSPIPMVAAMNEAHHVEDFKDKEVIAFDIELFFGGNKRLDGTVYAKTNSTGVRIERADGATLVYDGEQVYKTPADADWQGARFDIFTWQYFFMAPFKFTDPGTNWEPMADATMDGETYACAKLTFEPGTGDAPDDWYIAYKDQETDRLQGLAYIVTFGGKEQEEAEVEPHGITYHDYETVDGVPIAKTWKFWLWTEEEGMKMDQTIGEATISNVRFVDAGDLFATPENSQEVTL